MTINLKKLRAHLLLDPDTRDFVGKSADAVATDLKVAFKNRNRASMTGREVRSHIVDAEYDLLTDVKKAQILALLSSDDLDPFGMGANVVKDVFGGSDTLTALIAARVETVSAEIFYGLGRVRTGDVLKARVV